MKVKDFIIELLKACDGRGLDTEIDFDVNIDVETMSEYLMKNRI